jgi:hypothetical protein
MSTPIVFSKRNVARPGTCRAPTKPLVMPATCHMSRAVVAFLLSVLLMPPGRSIGDPGATPDYGSPDPAPAALAVSVSETPNAVRLRISATGDIEPGSVEVRFGGRKAIVLARDAKGRAIRSRPVRLPAPVVEDGASASYDAEDALVMTLRKQAAAETAAPPVDPEAAAR